MNSNRSLRSNTNITPGRASPNFQTTKNDSFNNRPSSPLNNRLASVREPVKETNEPPAKYFNDDDRRFHKITFERCADPPDRSFITNRDKFGQALSYVGYDLQKSKIDELWSNYRREISLKLFQRILNDEKPIDERRLGEAFEILYNKDRKYDWNVIDFNTFRTDMIEKGDRLTEEEFNKLRNLLGTIGGKVDLKKLTKTVEGNKNDCREKILIEKKEQKKEELERPSPRTNSPKSNNNVHILIDSTSDKLFIPPKTRSLQMKGAFFCEYFDSPNDALYFSNGYSFELKRNTPIWITVEPTVTSRYQTDTAFNSLDIRLFLFAKIPGSSERRLLHISSERTGSKTYLQLNDLSKGSYEIIPVTFGGVLRARSREVNDRPPIKKLRETKKGNFKMTDDYRDALEFIFDVFDYNENKQLDRQEYNLWTIRITGEEITDDDWLSIRDHVKLDKDEHISKEKFLKLNDFEVQDPNTTELDLWSGLKSMGFNYALELDMMCPFKLTVHLNESDAHLKPTSFVELAEIKKILIQFLKNKGEKIKLNNPNIQCFNYQDNSGSILLAENKSSSNVRLSIQIRNSKNSALTLPIDTRKPFVINIRHNTTQIIWFAHKLDSQRAMELDANIDIA